MRDKIQCGNLIQRRGRMSKQETLQLKSLVYIQNAGQQGIGAGLYALVLCICLDSLPHEGLVNVLVSWMALQGNSHLLGAFGKEILHLRGLRDVI